MLMTYSKSALRCRSVACDSYTITTVYYYDSVRFTTSRVRVVVANVTIFFLYIGMFMLRIIIISKLRVSLNTNICFIMS